MNKTIFIFASIGCILLLYGLKKNKLRYILLTAAAGILSYLAADQLSGLLNGNLPVNLFSTAVSAVFGIPGAVLLILLQTFL